MIPCLKTKLLNHVQMDNYNSQTPMIAFHDVVLQALLNPPNLALQFDGWSFPQATWRFPGLAFQFVGHCDTKCPFSPHPKQVSSLLGRRESFRLGFRDSVLDCFDNWLSHRACLTSSLPSCCRIRSSAVTVASGFDSTTCTAVLLSFLSS